MCFVNYNINKLLEKYTFDLLKMILSKNYNFSLNSILDVVKTID